MVEDTGDGLASGEVLHEASIIKCRSPDWLASWSWHVRRHLCSGLVLHAARPIMLGMFKMRAVGHFSAETDGTGRVFLEVAADANQTLEVANFWGGAKSPHRHGCTENVIGTKRDCP
jgi:hypothetical protein